MALRLLEPGENGTINPFNEYGRTKALAEDVYREWRAKDPENRSLIIIRPTVVFGEGNRGNVYNLLNQINSGAFAMIGNGKKQEVYGLCRKPGCIFDQVH